jgi:hypothetical protein
MYGSNNKYMNFAEHIQSSKVASVIIYSSTRKLNVDETISDDYERKKAQFNSKTFIDELEDAKILINHVIYNSRELY